jgi:hypothetical protein
VSSLPSLSSGEDGRVFFGSLLAGEGEDIRVRFRGEVPLDSKSEPLLGVKGRVLSNLKLMSLTTAQAIEISKRLVLRTLRASSSSKANGHAHTI